MVITRLCVAGYRSLRDVRLTLGGLTVVTGPNGSGKSSLYRALRLLADIAQGRIAGSLAAEGGLPSALWAGPDTFSASALRGERPVQGTRRAGPVSLQLGYAGADYGYAIDLGLPIPDRTAFGRDPEIKAEALWLGERLMPRMLLAARAGPAIRRRDESGAWRHVPVPLAAYDSMMTHAADAGDGAELLSLRERMRNWRFYDHFRTDREAPARRPQVGTRTPVLAGDGADLAAAVQTIIEVGDGAGFAAAVADAFAGATVVIEHADGLFRLTMRQPGLLRPLEAAELSDGTLRYLLLATALLSPRPPPLMVLNEPEASLHPDLLAPLARLVAAAAAETQIIVVSHAEAFVAAIEAARPCTRITLDKRLGETIADDCERPSWTWPSRS